MRIPILAANWKMHKTVQEALAFVQTVREPLGKIRGVETAIILESPLRELFQYAVADTQKDRVLATSHPLDLTALIAIHNACLSADLPVVFCGLFWPQHLPRSEER